MISGEKVYLKAIEPDDLDALMNWRNIPEFRKHFREYKEINSVMQKKWFETTVLNDSRTIMFSVFDSTTNELLGCCGLCYINWIHRYADLSLYIGYEQSYIDDRGFAEDACKLLLHYGFNELNLHKIWSELYEFDVRKIQLYKKLGFSVDGVLRDNYFFDAKWWNSIIYSMLSTEFSDDCE